MMSIFDLSNEHIWAKVVRFKRMNPPCWVSSMVWSLSVSPSVKRCNNSTVLFSAAMDCSWSWRRETENRVDTSGSRLLSTDFRAGTLDCPGILPDSACPDTMAVCPRHLRWKTQFMKDYISMLQGWTINTVGLNTEKGRKGPKRTKKDQKGPKRDRKGPKRTERGTKRTDKHVVVYYLPFRCLGLPLSICYMMWSEPNQDIMKSLLDCRCCCRRCRYRGRSRGPGHHHRCHYRCHHHYQVVMSL